MKDMKSKIIGLMLVIPLLLIFTTSSVVKTTEILVDIPVQSVAIEGESIRSIDLSADEEKVRLVTSIFPSGATNKRITYSTEAVEGAPKAEVLISADGTVTPLSAGTVRVIATADNGRTASVQLIFYSSSLLGASVINASATLEEGGTFSFINGTDYTLTPADATYSAVWTSAAPSIATVNKLTGKIFGVANGTTTVTASFAGKRIDEYGNVTDCTHTLDFSVTVTPKATSTGISFSGQVTSMRPTMNSTTFPFTYTPEKIAEYGDLSLEYDETAIREAQITYENGIGSISVSLRSSATEGATYPIIINDGEGNAITTVFVMKSVLSEASLQAAFNTIKLSRAATPIEVELVTDAPSSTSYVARYYSSDETVFSVQSINNACYITPVGEGTADLSAVLEKPDGTQINVEIDPIRFTVVSPYVVLAFNENSQLFGLEKEFAFGKYHYSGNALTNSSYTLGLRTQLSTDTSLSPLGSAFEADKLTFTSSDNSIATVTDGVLHVGNNSGLVTVTVSSAYNSTFLSNVTASFTLNCRSEGVNVYDYDSLMKATQSEYENVIQADVMLAPKLSDPNFTDYMNYLENVCTKKMHTTADDAYYVNNGENNASVRYCVEFKSDVFGNGHYLDGQYITRAVDMYNNTVFRGPLDLVRLYYSNNSSAQNAAVKAQDNIVFLVRENGISLRNVELKGCSDSAVNGNLSNLDNCGTVLEIVGDNCNLSYCRINNGRTAVRIFGTPAATSSAVASNPSAYRITAGINNCILSFSREFLLKIGSNQSKKNPSVSGFVDSSYTPAQRKDLYDHASPYFTKQNDSNYSMSEDKDDYFYDNYVMTDLTLSNSVFTNAGLFCIGFESKFGGLCLHGFDYNDGYKFGSQLGWRNVAGTSYPARIRMQGDVRFYDWKKVSDVNSDTLIEGDKQILDLTGLNMNVSNMINAYNGQNYDKLTVTYGGEKYVNGAIAFYGGGKNYSYVDGAGVSSSFNPLTEFNIPLSYFGSRVNLIYYSAGAEPFRFLLYASTGSLTLSQQRADIADNNAYNWLYRA